MQNTIPVRTRKHYYFCSSYTLYDFKLKSWIIACIKYFKNTSHYSAIDVVWAVFPYLIETKISANSHTHTETHCQKAIKSFPKCIVDIMQFQTTAHICGICTSVCSTFLAMLWGAYRYSICCYPRAIYSIYGIQQLKIYMICIIYILTGCAWLWWCTIAIAN